MRFISFVLTFIVICISNMKYAYAFFAEEYKKHISYGAFKQINNTDAYLGLSVGFIAKTWTPNISTLLTPSSDKIAEYNTIIGDQMFKKTSDRYTYYLSVILGLHHHGSRIRHELDFSWYGIVSKPLTLSGDNLLSRTIEGQTYNYANIDNKLAISVGVYSNIYRLLYSVYTGFDDVFTFLNIKWDIFFGIGAGFSILSGGTYAGEEMKSTSAEDSVNKSYEYKNNRVSTSTNAIDNSLFKSTNFGISYQAKVGLLSNISQTFASSISVVFGATSRPLLTTRFRYIDKIDGSNTHLEYHIAIEFGVLLKAFEIAL